MKILVLIPCYNEAANIGKVLAEITESYPTLDILVVDDGSQDNTIAIAQSHSKAIVIALPFNMGIGASVQTGYIWAAQHHYDIVIRIDGDGQHPPKALEEHIRVIQNGESDMGIGSRFLNLNDSRGYLSSFWRRLGIRYLKHLIHLTAGKAITDPTSGFISCNQKIVKWFAEHYPYDYPEPEAILLVLQNKGTIKEIPVVMRERNAGQSSIGPLDTLYYLIKVTLALLILQRRKIRFS